MARTGYCWVYLNDTRQLFARISIWHVPATVYDNTDMTRSGYLRQYGLWHAPATVYNVYNSRYDTYLLLFTRTDCKYWILTGSRYGPGPCCLHATAPMMSSHSAVLSAWWCQRATLGRLLGEQEGGFPFKLRKVYYTGRFKMKSPLSAI